MDAIYHILQIKFKGDNNKWFYSGRKGTKISYTPNPTCARHYLNTSGSRRAVKTIFKEFENVEKIFYVYFDYIKNEFVYADGKVLNS